MKGYRYLLSFFIIMLLLSLTGCRDHTVQSIALGLDLPVGQGALSLMQTPIVPVEQEGRLLEIEGQLQTPVYEVEYPEDFSTPSTAVALRLEYRSSLDLELHASYDTGESLRRTLPSGNGSPVSAVVPLAAALLQEFQFKASGTREKSPAGDLFQIEALALQELRSTDEDAPGVTISFSPPSGQSPLYQHRYRLDYSYRREVLPAGSLEEPGEPAEQSPQEVVPLLVGTLEDSASFRLFAKEGDHSIYFYSRDLEFAPTEFTVQTNLPGFQLQQVSRQRVWRGAADTPPPIPADMGTILRYRQQAWRRSDWELFSWNLFPSILVFDFRDYHIQAAFLKRLAFFVEKKGSAGTLLSNRELEPLHGWNAHDYRAADLAAFFQTAREQGFSLNPEEQLLKRILLEQGVIHEVDGEFLPGTGGFISLSQQSSSRLRYIFATHEGYHGLYFASSRYRQAVHGVWTALSEDERQFWKLFLDWKHYNTEDVYLLENEFQAYLMQQHRSYVDTYFKEYIIPRFLSFYPEYQGQADYFLAHYGEHFSRSARLIEEAAQSLVGISAGDLVCIRESEPTLTKN
ncbi:MAG: hypothetical protein K9L66_06140 [Spirochaetaceae bacterium]|nr:hypothetical protein [Spirochaetaceae bacterium]MCF7951161.1 hypothetical protein [Spirochaetaceae bacterium]